MWRGFCLTLVGVLACALAQGDGPSPEEWARQIRQSEIPALRNELLQTAPTRSRAVRENLLAMLETGLSGEMTEDNYRIQAVRYVTLITYRTLLQMKVMTTANADLQSAEARCRALAESLTSGSDLPSPDSALATLREIESLAQRAQEGILRERQLASTRALLLRFKLLASLEPRVELREGIASVEEGIELLQAGNAESAQSKFEAALEKVFGAKAKNWDGRHLFHFLELKIKTLALARDAKYAFLVPHLSPLAGSTSREEYGTRSEALEKDLRGILAKDENKILASDTILYFSPEGLRGNVAGRLRAMQRWVPETRAAYLKAETTLQSLTYTRKLRRMSMLGNLEGRLSGAAALLTHTTDVRLLRSFHQSAPLFQLVTLLTLEAILDHSSAAKKYYYVWNRKLDRMLRGETYSTEEDETVLREGLKIERGEGVRRAWFNRHNASIAAVSVMLAAEAISIPFTGGGSAAAMPATLAALTTVPVAAAQTFLVANSALNIADRTKSQGVSGLMQMDTAFDALVILSLTPRYTPGAVAAEGTVGTMSQRALTKLAQFQYSAGPVAMGLGLGYGGYLTLNAEKVSEELAKEGVRVTPEEVRRRGLTDMAIALLSYGRNRTYYAKGVKAHGENFEAAIKPGTFVGGTLSRWGNYFRQYPNLKNSWNNPGWAGRAGTIGLGAYYLGLDYLLVTEGLLISYTNFDFTYLNHIRKESPLPDLREGESAVILTGFDPADYFLWLGARARYSHREEFDKYGDKLSLYSYRSPEELFEILREHRKLHGPIRYLKIATHGRPGKLYTREVWGSPDGKVSGGWIDKEYLEANRATLEARGKEDFAPEARITLWACLVGTNLDQAHDGFTTDAGESFLNTMADILLPNGGRIDASTRALIGWDATGGALGHYLHREGFRTAWEDRPRMVIPLAQGPLVTGEEPVEPTADGRVASADDENPSVTEVIGTMARRLGTIYFDYPPVWWRYGVNLQGPHWTSDYYRHVEVPAH